MVHVYHKMVASVKYERGDCHPNHTLVSIQNMRACRCCYDIHLNLQHALASHVTENIFYVQCQHSVLTLHEG